MIRRVSCCLRVFFFFLYESFFITVPSFDSVQSHFITSIFVTKASRVSYFQPLPHGAGVSTFQSPLIIGPQDFSQYLSIVSSAWIDVQCQERHKKKQNGVAVTLLL